MTNGHIKLVRIPKLLQRDDLVRRLPKSSRFRDLSGRTFERCTVIGLAGFIDPYSAWLCECRCGRKFIVRQNAIQPPGHTCGCFSEKHGGTGTALYSSWAVRKYEMCDRWRESYAAFRSDVGERPHGKFLVAIRRNKLLGPGNFQWVDRKTVARRAKHARLFTWNGQTKCMSEWAEDIGISNERMRQRIEKCLKSGSDIGEALTTPANKTMPSRVDYSLQKKDLPEQWFDGRVHHTTDEFPDALFRKRAAERGHTGRVRRLGDHVLFRAVKP